MRKIFYDNPMDDVRAMMRKLKAQNNVNLVLILCIGFALLAAIATFFIVKGRCANGFDRFCDDYDDDECCFEDDDDCCCGPAQDEHLEA